jgi:hypothetical protein
VFLQTQIKRLSRIVLGCLFLLLGLAGLVLPVLQWWLFLAMGVIVLSIDVWQAPAKTRCLADAYATRLRNATKQTYPCGEWMPIIHEEDNPGESLCIIGSSRVNEVPE